MKWRHSHEATRRLGFFRLAVTVVLLGTALIAFGHEGKGLLNFYAQARDRAANGPNESDLNVLCQKQLKGSDVPRQFKDAWLSFLSMPTEPVLLIAFTEKKVVNPRDVLILHVGFNPFPTALRNAFGTLDWAYVYDRNGDGKIDYLTYLQNAHPVLPDPLPSDFPPIPRPNKNGRIGLSKELAKAMVHYGELVFRHYADDDFDGKVDGAVIEEESAETAPFIKGWIAYYPSTLGGPIDQAWAFRHEIGDKLSMVSPGKKGYTFRFVGEEMSVKDLLDGISKRLLMVNRVMSECNINPQLFERPTY